ncbi:MAG TPA: hypothetical protein VM099_09610, partial [Gemmatimonadaceae bacterium]|nr:hypothetical protein [Gemmatimonadaceae bacterium]
ARLLTAPRGNAGTTDKEPRLPHEYVRAIADIAADLSGPARAIGSEAVVAARHAAAAEAALSQEIQTLARDADPIEAARLEQKLGTLATVADAETDEQRKLRGLLSDQLELMRRLTTRLQETQGRRERVQELLRTLWLQIANLRAADVADKFEASAVTDRVRAVCADIERYTGAMSEINSPRPPA